MRTKIGPNGSADKHVKEIKRKTRRQFSAEEKIRIVLDGLREVSSISELCRREGITERLYSNWSKDFMEAGKKRLAGDTTRQATFSQVTGRKREARDLKEVVVEQMSELRLLKKYARGWGRPRMRYPASEKLEIIRLAEGSHLPVKRTLEKLGVSRPTYYHPLSSIALQSTVGRRGMIDTCSLERPVSRISNLISVTSRTAFRTRCARQC
jgi:transposase